MTTIAGMRIDQNFLFEHTGVTPDQLLHDQVLHTASLIAVILLAAAAVALFAAWLRGTSRATHPGAPGPDSQTWESIHNLPFPSVPLAILTPAIAFLLTPLGAPIWRHAPEMQFLQFPWRLLAVLAPVFALALARALSPAIPPIASKQDQDPDTPQTAGAPGLASETWVLPDAPSIAAVSRSAGYKTLPAFALLLAASLTIPAYHIFHQPCDPEDTAPARLALFHSNSGTDPTDEYTPATADNDALQPDNPPYWLAPDPNDGPLAVAPIYQTDKDSTAPPAPGPAPRDLALNLQNPEFLILNLRDYPAWRILRNGALVTARTPRGDGLIAIPIPAGASTLDIHYAQTPDQTLGGTITLLALTLFLFTLYRPPSGHSAPPAESQ
jgi:hypothetical protein